MISKQYKNEIYKNVEQRSKIEEAHPYMSGISLDYKLAINLRLLPSLLKT